jgi:hypothetical protein
MRRREFLFTSLLLPAGVAYAQSAATINIYKTPTCGCCGVWVEHLKTAGLKTAVKEVTSTAEYRKQYGVPEKLASCHTAVVDGYSIEGHVPVAEIKRMLKERPKAKGLAVPGMPMGSPGMEAGGRRDHYQVLLFQEDGKTTVYKDYPAQ